MRGQKKEQQTLWEIYLPLLFCIVVLPFVTRLFVYSCGYGNYDWYMSDDVVADFFSYYKSYCIVFVGIISGAVLLFRGLYDKEAFTGIKQFIPLFLYGGFVIASGVMSAYTETALTGNFFSFESVPVLLSYIAICLYAFVIGKDGKAGGVLYKGFAVLAILCIGVGLLQMMGADPFDFPVIKTLIFPEAYYDTYAGQVEDVFSSGTVSLFLYNPNYAAIVLLMLYCIFLHTGQKARGKRRIFPWTLAFFLFVVLWFTYSRTALLLAIIMTVVSFVIVFWENRKYIMPAILCAFAAVAMLFVLDLILGGRFIGHLVDKSRAPLQEIELTGDGVEITYDGEQYLLYTEDNKLFVQAENTGVLTTQKDGRLTLPFGDGNEAVLIENQILCTLAEQFVTFVYEDGEYYYCPDGEKLVLLPAVAKVDLGGAEGLFSARGYIWSRTLPLLSETIFLGKGPDSFPEVFPQMDLAGKIVYCDTPLVTIEKAHNGYLNIWVQTGLLSLVCLLIFFGVVLKKGKELLRQNTKAESGFIGGCYMAAVAYMLSFLMNDSTVQTTPIFMICCGLVLAKAKNEN